MLSRLALRLSNRLARPTLRLQILIAFAVLASQAGIAVTGAIVRVTSSGLGCPTWPQCFPGSFVPVPSARVGVVHQAVEFGNRMLTIVVVVCAASIVVAVLAARRRAEVRWYAWAMPGGTFAQALLGGVTVRLGLVWWTVALHLLLSMAMVWLAAVLCAKVATPDEGITTVRAPAPLRWLTGLTGVVLAGVLVAGTLVTAAGPHAGDASVEHPVARLPIAVVRLVQLHAEMVTGYLALLVGLACGLLAVGAGRPVLRRVGVVVGVAVAQSLVGVVQYLTHVPAALVAVHVGGAALATAATAALWASLHTREIVPSAPTAKITETADVEV